MRNQLIPGKPLAALALAALLMAPVAAAAQCDIPLISQRISTPPNVMILLDSSGSMNGVMYHPDYDQKTLWSGGFDWDTNYKVSSAGTYTPSDFLSSAGADTTTTAELVSGLHGRNGEYLGNYLNWVYFHATPEQRAAIPKVTRQQVANTAVKAVVNSAPGVRYGLARFNGDTGATILSNVGEGIAALETQVDAMVASGYTPTAEALVDIMEHFQTTGADAPIEYECQQTFVVVVTDGIPTQDRDVPAYIGDQDGDGREPGDCASIGFPEINSNCSDYLDDVAFYMAHNDMRGDLEDDQNISVYTIGFGIRSQLLADAAVNGNGLYSEAWDLTSLTVQLGSVVGDIVNRISAGAAVAVVSTETGDGSHLYRGKFMPGPWQGFLECFELPYSNGQAPKWEAGRVMYKRNPDSRTIYTSLNDNLIEFSTVNAAELGYFIAPDGPGSGPDETDAYGPDLDNDFDSADEAAGPNFQADYVDDVIEWVRGEDLAGYRQRGGWLLGDLVHSTPVVVGPPRGFRYDEAFMNFRESWKYRRSMVYVGSNGGMLHAFNADTGVEEWAYVPRRVLGKLELLAEPTYCHQSYVDLSPKAYDVEINGSWRTVLVCGLRTGGDSYFAFDVTNPDAPQFLWETSIPNMKSSYTEPVVVQTHWGTALWAGSGPNPDGKAYSTLIRLDNGNILLNHQLGSTIAGTNAATAPAVYDQDQDGIADLIFQGDFAGNMYRWDISDPGTWYVSTFFSGNQPIQAQPALAIDEAGQLNVYFGTGKYTEGSDLNDMQQQSFYCLRDDGTSTTISDANLLRVADSDADSEGWQGWYRDLVFGAGERITQPAVIVEGVVYFTSFKPSNEICSAGGDSYLYHIDYRNGTEVDSDDDGELDDESVADALGRGVASRPVVNLAAEELIVQTSDARLNVEDLLVGPQRIRVRAWRQQFQTANTADVEPDGQ